MNEKLVAIDPQGNLSAGEYTGKCSVTGLHCVSFYNGYIRKFDHDPRPAKE